MRKQKKIYQILNSILLILAMACLFYYDYEGGLWLKGVTSSWFLMLGIVNLIFAYHSRFKKKGVVWLLVLGLLSTMIADVMLGIHFILGGCLFAFGHILYFAAYCVLERFHKKDLLCIVIVGAVSLFFVIGTPFIRLEDSSLTYLLTAYAIIISCMLGKAVGNVLTRTSLTRYLLLIGSLLFWFSDLMLALNMFGDGGRLAGSLCMYTYWPGQYLLGHTLYHFVLDKKE